MPDITTETYTLITNLTFAQRDDNLRLYCHALLITEGHNVPSTLRGFGTEASWEVFNIWLNKDQLPFTLAPAQDNSKIVIGDDDIAKPLFSGTCLTLGGTKFFLQAEDPKQPLDVHTQKGDVSAIWDILLKKVLTYYPHTSIPHLSWNSPQILRERLAHHFASTRT